MKSNIFLNMNTQDRQIEIEKITLKLKDKFDLITSSYGDGILPTFLHRATNIEFKYIPSGEFNMGLSQKEESSAKKICRQIPADLKEMRPVHKVNINHFLVSSCPVLNHSASNFIDSIDLKYPNSPVFLNRDEAESLLHQTGCRMIHEKEWEYMCRGTTQTLFVFGDKLIEDDELAKWLSWDFSAIDKIKSNSFNIYGLFTGEWCQDKYKSSYDEDAKIDDNAYVIRGGGALFWPWQDQEWVWCMSAMRTSSHDIIDGKCGLRLVYDIPEN
jgi:formylglycine-generating enzyme required for sulfatase activity